MRSGFSAVAAALLTAGVLPVLAATGDAPGVTGSEIKIGQTNPYSGPLSALGSNGVADVAYIRWLDDHGGVNGRRLTLLSRDDSYSPPRTVEETRRLVEQDGVAIIFRSMGTASNVAIARYLNDRKIPQLFTAGGASDWNEPQRRPWSLGSTLSYQVEAAIYAHYALSAKPAAQMAVLYQDDDLGRDYLAGLQRALGPAGRSHIVAQASFEVTDPTIDSQIVTLQASGADVLFSFGTVRFTSQAIRKVYDLGWKPLMFVPAIANSVGTVLRPAGLEKSVGLVTATYVKDPSDPQWHDDPAVRDWESWMDKYVPHGDKADVSYVYGAIWGSVLAHVLTQCGDDLSRGSIMQQATHLTGVSAPLLLPGITVNTSPADYRVLKQARLERFDGRKWVLFSDILSAD